MQRLTFLFHVMHIETWTGCWSREQSCPNATTEPSIQSIIEISLNPTNRLKPSGYHVYLQVYVKTVHFADAVCVCVPYDSHSKELLLPHTHTDWYELDRNVT